MFLIAHFIPPKNNNSVTTISNSSDNDFFPLMYFLWGGKFSENSFTQIYVSPGWGGGGGGEERFPYGTDRDARRLA